MKILMWSIYHVICSWNSFPYSDFPCSHSSALSDFELICKFPEKIQHEIFDENSLTEKECADDDDSRYLKLDFEMDMSSNHSVADTESDS